MAFQLGSNFQLDAQLPLDVRTVVSNEIERNSLVTFNKAYAGLIVYVTGENKYYYYNGVSWIELNISGGSGGTASLNFVYTNSTLNATKNTRIGVDTSISSFIINLPTANLQTGDVIEFIDLGKNFRINNLIIRSQLHNIEGESGNPGLTCNISGAHFLLIFTVSGWRLSILDNNFQNLGITPANNSSVIPLLFLNIQENNNNELFDSNDVQNYKIPWNNVEYFNTDYADVSSTISSTKFVTYNPVNKNIYFRQPGIYNVDLRYSSYNLRDASDFLRARLRSFDTPIPGGLSQNEPLLDVGFDNSNPPQILPYTEQRPRVLAAFAQGPIGTTFNGEAMCAGFTTFRISSAQYVTADFLHAGALRVIPGQADQTWGYPVYSGPYGNLPFMFISKII
jgi:hypothetical protein